MALDNTLTALNNILQSEERARQSDEEIALNLLNMELTEKERQREDKRFRIQQLMGVKEAREQRLFDLQVKAGELGIAFEDSQKGKGTLPDLNTPATGTGFNKVLSDRHNDVMDNMATTLDDLDSIENNIKQLDTQVSGLTNEIAATQMARAFAGQNFPQLSESVSAGGIMARSSVDDAELEKTKQMFKNKYGVELSDNQLTAVRDTFIGLQQVKHAQLIAERNQELASQELGLRFSKLQQEGEPIGNMQKFYYENIRTQAQLVNSIVDEYGIEPGFNIPTPNSSDFVFDPADAELLLGTFVGENSKNLWINPFSSKYDVPEELKEPLRLFEVADPEAKKIAAVKIAEELITKPELIDDIDTSNLPLNMNSEGEKTFLTNLLDLVTVMRQANFSSYMTNGFTARPDLKSAIEAAKVDPSKLTKEEKKQYDLYLELYNIKSSSKKTKDSEPLKEQSKKGASSSIK